MKSIFIFLLILGSLASCKTYNLLEETKTQTKSMKLDSTFRYNPDYQYAIRKDDKINISVWGQDDLSVGSVYGIYNSNEVYGKWLLVDAKGNVSVPKLGVFHVLGMTVPKLKDTLTTRFGKWIQTPVVDVKVMNKEITVLGEVRNPGVFQVDKDQNTLLELLSKTGGLEFYSNLKSIKVLRQEGQNVKVAHINLSKSGQYANQNIQLHPGDVVIVSSKSNKEFDKRIATIIPFATALTAAAILFKAFGL
jgi:polysaccharide biosynthesis/export protein